LEYEKRKMREEKERKEGRRQGMGSPKKIYNEGTTCSYPGCNNPVYSCGECEKHFHDYYDDDDDYEEDYDD